MPMQKNVSMILKNAMDNLTPATKEDTTGTVVLAEEYPNKIKKSVANFRFIYYNDPTVRGLILNNTFTANSSFQITIKKGYENVANIEEARKYIEDRCKPGDWNLHEVIEESLIKAQRDRQCFIHVPIVNNQAHLNQLTYDGENYDFMMVPDVENGKVAGYVQKHPETPDLKNWDNMKWDDLVEASEKVGEFTTTSFYEEEMIHFVIIKEDGSGDGLMEAILEKIPEKWDYEGFQVSVAQKTGAIAIIKIGDERHDVKKVDMSFVQKALDVFRGRIKKTAVALPDGTSVEQMSNSTLPAIPDYRRTVLMEIYIALQTPRSMFNTKDSNRSSSETATDFETGYGVFLNKLRTIVKSHFERKLIDKDLSLQSGFADCVGGIEINYTKDVSMEEPLEPTEEDLSGENSDLNKAVKNQKENEPNSGDKNNE